MVTRFGTSFARAMFLVALGVTATRAQDMAPGAYTLKADNGKFLARCADCVPNTSYADSAGAHEGDPWRPWARWMLTKRPNGRWVLQADSGRYLARCSNCGPGNSADSAFVHETNPDASWAQWTLERRPNGRWALRSDSGKYLARCVGCFTGSVIQDNVFVHETNPDAPWAQWAVEPVGTTRTFATSMTPAAAAAMIERLASATQRWVDIPRSEQAHATRNHINGLARVGPYWIVNYDDVGGDTGRLLYWKRGSDYAVYEVDGVGSYLAGMDGAGNIVAYTSSTPTLRFLRMPPDGPPVALPDFTYGDSTNFARVGLAVDPDTRTYVLMTRNGSRDIDIREGSPGNWRLVGTLPADYATSWSGGEEESRPLVYMGNDVYAAFVLKPGDDTYEFSYQLFSLQGAGTARTVVPYGSTTTVTLPNKAPAGSQLDPFKGYASFRWAGTVVFDGTMLEICASPRELNNAYNGDYSCWATR
ncbi:MAG: hypothetical protein R2745_22565 [Vicinamibacterales bacterium]